MTPTGRGCYHQSSEPSDVFLLEIKTQTDEMA